jgi:hypothetical protein
MKEMLSDTNKSILNLKDQMNVSQKLCLSLIQRIKRQTIMKGSMERMILIESTKKGNQENKEITTVFAAPQVVSSSNATSSGVETASIRCVDSSNLPTTEQASSVALTIPMDVLGLDPEQVPRESTTLKSA